MTGTGRLALVALVAFLGCHGSDHVLAVAKTKTFHTPRCLRALMAHTEEMTVAGAESLGLRPCPVCKPLEAK